MKYKKTPEKWPILEGFSILIKLYFFISLITVGVGFWCGSEHFVSNELATNIPIKRQAPKGLQSKGSIFKFYLICYCNFEVVQYH